MIYLNLMKEIEIPETTNHTPQEILPTPKATIKFNEIM
jgi:hypothetical protein